MRETLFYFIKILGYIESKIEIYQYIKKIKNETKREKKAKLHLDFVLTSNNCE